MRDRWLAAALCVLVLHLALASIFAASGVAPLYRDALGYWQLGVQAAGGDWFLLDSPGATRTPGYPWWLAVLQLAFGSKAMVAAGAIQQLALVATGALVGATVWRLTGSAPAALLALVLSAAAFSRHLVATYLWSDNLLGVALTLHVVVLLAWCRRPSPLLALGAGALLGLCALIRPAAQLAFLPALVVMLFRGVGPSTARGLPLFGRHVLPLLLGAAVLVAPWVARNQLAFGEPFLTRFAGRTLWISCFHPHAAELPQPALPALERVFAAVEGEEVDPRDAWSVYAALRARGASEVEADDLMRQAALSTIGELPVAYAASVAEQFAWFWAVPYRIPRWRHDDPYVTTEGTFLDQESWHSEALLPLQEGILHLVWHPSAALYAISSGVTGVAILALLTQRRRRTIGLALAMPLGYFALVTAAASYPLYRFRCILEPIMILTVAIALAPGLDRLAARIDRRPRT